MASYLRQGALIFGFTLLGEALNRLLPLPIPAAVYGLILLFFALLFKIVKVEQVKQISNFLLTILPVLFVSPAVNLLESWGILAPHILPLVMIIISSTVIVFVVAGVISQRICGKETSRGTIE